MSTPLADAAVRLGISREALRKRINRGSIPAEKRQGRWVVFLEADTGTDAASRQQDAGQDNTRHEPDAERDTKEDALVAALRDEIGFLRSELERRGEELRREQMLIAGFIERPAAISAHVQDAPQDAIPAPQSNDATPRASEPYKPISDTLALGWRRWWRRITGGG